MQGRATALTVITIAVLAALSGCTGNSAPSEPSVDQVRALTQLEQARVDQAEQHLIRRCMEHNGFRYWVARRADTDTVRAFTYRFVQDDVGWAREHGYGQRLRQAFFAQKEHDPNLLYRERLSLAERERFSAVLGGGPDAPILSVRLPAGGTVRTLDGGCQHAARQELYGDTQAFFRADKIATNLTALYLPNLTRDPRFAASVNAWSQCMRDATGRDYPNPDAARADASERAIGLSSSQAHAIEVELAVAEATCARQTSLPSILSHLDREYGDPVRDRYGDEIATSNRMKMAALQQAERLEHPH